MTNLPLVTHKQIVLAIAITWAIVAVSFLVAVPGVFFFLFAALAVAAGLTEYGGRIAQPVSRIDARIRERHAGQLSIRQEAGAGALSNAEHGRIGFPK